MNKILEYIISLTLKTAKLTRKQSGFTLIELLVALVISSIIISSLLGFMVNIITTERREQAKTNSELEIQAAIDYIARDLRQAVYIYDNDSLTTDHSDTGDSGIRDQIPPESTARGCGDASTCRPVLVFWKRELKENVIPVGSGYDDKFLYSLVGYYLIKDNSSRWSGTARISRFQIEDGVNLDINDDGDYEDANEAPDHGFATFNLSGTGTLKEKMNQWTKATEAYTQQALVLVDFIDQSTDTAEIPLPNSAMTTTEYDEFCDDRMSEAAQLVPNYTEGGFPEELKTGSFYACIDSDSSQARIYIRGNALARFQNIDNAEYKSSRSQFFPTTNRRVQGSDLLGAD
ncbi:MAG: prepilin-type N-terminal cleavage/methylation domain-containing protein [Hormoscilla sp. GM7CHS1pb]|nr:prepilin-type N-terminal cleavage/methylation domain-containing protein [Hormoscilla sp. GM7CHS1pb]